MQAKALANVSPITYKSTNFHSSKVSHREQAQVCYQDTEKQGFKSKCGPECVPDTDTTYVASAHHCPSQLQGPGAGCSTLPGCGSLESGLPFGRVKIAGKPKVSDPCYLSIGGSPTGPPCIDGEPLPPANNKEKPTVSPVAGPPSCCNRCLQSGVFFAGSILPWPPPFLSTSWQSPLHPSVKPGKCRRREKPRPLDHSCFDSKMRHTSPSSQGAGLAGPQSDRIQKTIVSESSSLPQVFGSSTVPIMKTGGHCKLQGKKESNVVASRTQTCFSDSWIVNRLRSHFRDALRSAKFDCKRVYLELYAGACVVSSMLQKDGCAVISFEIDNGPEFDLTWPCLHQVNLGWLRGGCVACVFLGTQCSSWSRARRGPPGSSWCAIRNNSYSRGLPDLKRSDQDKINNGYLHAKLTCHIIRTCVSHCILRMLENRLTSIMWICPSLVSLVSKDCAQEHIFDQCQYGTRWKKATNVVSWNCSHDLFLCHKCKCYGRKGVCSKTGKPHIIFERLFSTTWCPLDLTRSKIRLSTCYTYFPQID